MPKYQKGNYRVTRWCCTSGLCVDCHKRGNHGDLTKRERVVQTDHVSRHWAKHVVTGWSVHGYAPTIEKMEDV
jgi:hypothetical protein